MPRVRLTKGAIDSLPTLNTDVVYWDTGLPGFGVKVTPKGRKVAQKVFAARLEAAIRQPKNGRPGVLQFFSGAGEGSC